MGVPPVIPQRYEPDVPLERLVPHPANPNESDLGLLCELVDANGFAGAVLAQESTGLLIDGEHRWKAALEKGMTVLPVLWLDVDDDQRDRLLASLNESTRRGRNDEAKLIALLTGLAGTERGLEGTAFDGDDLDALIAELGGGTGGGGGGIDGDPDEVPEPPADPIAKPGDLWRIGEHRLLVSDCTDMTAVEEMLAGDRCDCMWTDPPYGVNYQNFTTVEQAKKARRRTDGLLVSNDRAADLPELLAGAYAVATAALKPGAAVYIAHPPGALCRPFLDAFFAAGWKYHEGLIWVKDRMVLGHADYHYSHEPIMYGYTAGEGRRGRGGEGWYGDNSQTSVFEVPKPSRSENWMVDGQGRPVAVDNGAAFSGREWLGGDFAPVDGPDITEAEARAAQARLAALKPEFEAAGHPDWHADVMKQIGKQVPPGPGTQAGAGARQQEMTRLRRARLAQVRAKGRPS